MDSGLSEQKQFEIEHLEIQLQQQRGMLWLLGEIMKEAVNISSFRQLMAILTDMLMGVMGVTTCYLWIAQERDYKVYFRSVELQNDFRAIKVMEIPSALRDLKGSYTFEKEEIVSPLIDCINVPLSRLAVPLKNFNDNSIFGALVLEHEEPNFFTDNTIAFFETLTVFISINAQNSRLLQSVSKESQTDPLTGAYNRRHLQKALDKVYHAKSVMTVAVIDTDNFKQVNDILGHLKGDTVLKAISQLAKGSVKEYGGEVVRYGGDEFVILIPVPIEEAIHILEEFRQAVYYIQLTYDVDIPVTVTLGVCTYPDMADDPHQAVRAADNALIRGKIKGKNRVVLAVDEDIVKSRIGK
ncbi:sensor domain-containing diguanylate cyclase [Cellulosilyticum sp. I15G10I2]|uniref:sensor domain-containing diguanylate cyclase n=1 Tax=Cellulosilyticum sp. I15G10I2 TaxID=1892843 RepID=UPI00085BC115|nr:GGDEF domain-containing protein [Cellulosilyticum sp. I15G10I2]